MFARKRNFEMDYRITKIYLFFIKTHSFSFNHLYSQYEIILLFSSRLFTIASVPDKSFSCISFLNIILISQSVAFVRIARVCIGCLFSLLATCFTLWSGKSSGPHWWQNTWERRGYVRKSEDIKYLRFNTFSNVAYVSGG